jgi:hypothetical protein
MCVTRTDAPTRFSPAGDFTTQDKLLVVTCATSEKLTIIVIASKKEILLSINISFLVAKKGNIP